MAISIRGLCVRSSFSHRPAGAALAVCGLLAISGALCGCGSPTEATFVSSARTEELIKPVRSVVQKSVAENFGTPQTLVAWLRLPVEYGRAKGTVAEDGNPRTNVFQVQWDSPEAEKAVAGVDLSGAGLLWTSGSNVGAKTVVRGVERDLDFEVYSYDPATHTMAVNATMEDPPKKGDTFEVVGFGMQKGRMLYMQHCMHCHGVSGDGNGPTAPYLNPLPRDYRLGVFKFTSTLPQDRARRDDLHRTIRNGIPGTYMPSFLLLRDDELEAITEYIRWLAMRGEYEKRLVDGLYGDYSITAVAQRVKDGEDRAEIEKKPASDEFREEFAESSEAAAAGIAKIWERAEATSSVIHPKTPRTDPAADPKSVERGRVLFLSGKSKCASCHGLAGKGDGPQTQDFQKRPNGTEYPKPGLYDDWGHPLKPRDLTSGIYRGGRRPLDIYRRIYAGIKGAQMPAFSTALNEQEIWDLVNYVLSIPYDGKAPPALKAAPVAETASRSEQ